MVDLEIDERSFISDQSCVKISLELDLNWRYYCRYIDLRPHLDIHICVANVIGEQKISFFILTEMFSYSLLT